MITTPLQYHAVAVRIGQLANVAAGTEAAKELKILTKLLVEFENRRLQRVHNNLKEA
jgi:hypothetical protein